MVRTNERRERRRRRLRRFVTAPAWAHFDIFAWAPKEKPSRPQGGEAQALRACWRVLKARFGEA